VGEVGDLAPEVPVDSSFIRDDVQIDCEGQPVGVNDGFGQGGEGVDRGPGGSPSADRQGASDRRSPLARADGAP
jgi:hypothetical protein